MNGSALECSTGFPPTNQPLAGFTQQMCALFTLYEDTFRHSFSSEIICHSWVSLRQVGSGWTAEEDVVKSENSRCVGGGIGPAPESHNTLTLMSHSFFFSSSSFCVWTRQRSVQNKYWEFLIFDFLIVFISQLSRQLLWGWPFLKIIIIADFFSMFISFDWPIVSHF